MTIRLRGSEFQVTQGIGSRILRLPMPIFSGFVWRESGSILNPPGGFGRQIDAGFYGRVGYEIKTFDCDVFGSGSCSGACAADHERSAYASAVVA